jgi:hypothetical protein
MKEREDAVQAKDVLVAENLAKGSLTSSPSASRNECEKMTAEAAIRISS